MGLEPTALCLGRTGPESAPETPLPNLATRHPPVEAEDHQIANRRYYTVIRANSNLIADRAKSSSGRHKSTAHVRQA
jgi:hypothetical protein